MSAAAAPSRPAHHAHLHSLRLKWTGFAPAERAAHVAHPAHLYTLLSSFLPRGSTEGSVFQFFACLKHISACAGAGSEPQQFAFSAPTCAQFVALLDELITTAAIEDMPISMDESLLNAIARVQQLARADFAEQGWSHNTVHNFAFRMAGNGPSS